MQFLAENCPVRLGFFYHSCIMLGLSGYDSTAHDKHIQVVQASRLGLDLYILSFLFFRSWVRMSKHAVSIYARARLRQSLFFFPPCPKPFAIRRNMAESLIEGWDELLSVVSPHPSECCPKPLNGPTASWERRRISSALREGSHHLCIFRADFPRLFRVAVSFFLF